MVMGMGCFQIDSARLETGNCFELLPRLRDNSVHLVLTDPPYFLDALDDRWNDTKIHTTNSKTIHNLPAGMKFCPKQSMRFGSFMSKLAKELFKKLVPGGFFISFSQARLYQRMAVASEDAGFWIRDMLIWHYTKRSQAKAFSVNHFIDKSDISDKKKDSLKHKIDGRKTPQLKPAFEPLMLAQKPKEGTFVDNYDAWETGLIDCSVKIDGHFPSNLITIEKPVGAERNDHPTQKPVALLEHLIEIFSKEGQTVLDPFLGSGSTAVASWRKKRNIIGYEIEKTYMQIARERLKNASKSE